MAEPLQQTYSDELTRLLLQHVEEFKNLEYTQKKRKDDLELTISLEKQSIGEVADSTLKDQHSKKILEFNELCAEERAQLLSKHQRERETILPEAKDESNRIYNRTVGRIKKRGYRKRGGYRQRQKEAWSNLIMSIWGTQKH